MIDSNNRTTCGKALNGVANLYDQVEQKNMAVATRQQAVAILRKALDPVPVGVTAF